MIIGNINIKKPLILAPMEDVTDNSMRIICKGLSADIVYSEFASSEALVRNAAKTISKLNFTEEERPIAIQIFGSKPATIETAIKIVESKKPDFIDINCGCWVRKVVLREEGAGLLKNLKKFEEVVKTAVNSSKLPVTVKTRLGWDSKNIVILEVAKIVEASGAKALAIHCRTREQAYKGNADWSWLEKVKKIITIPLIGNGDVLTPMDVKRMFDTGCDGVMIGRGAVNNPFIFRETKYFLKHNDLPPPVSQQEKINTCLKHLKLLIQFKGKRGLLMFRKFYSHYLKGLHNISVLRNKLVQLETYEEIENSIFEYFNIEKDINV